MNHLTRYIEGIENVVVSVLGDIDMHDSKSYFIDENKGESILYDLSKI